MRTLPALLLLIATACATAPPPAKRTYWDKLSPAAQERMRATLSACNPDNWDCCASVVFAPNDGSQCAFAPNGPCSCPSPD